MKKSFGKALMAMLTMIPMSANAQDSVVVEKVTFSMPTITKDNADDEEVSEVVDTNATLTIKDKKRFIKDGKSTLLSVNMNYLETANALERFATRFFFRDSTSENMWDALFRYFDKLGTYDPNGKGITDATEKYNIEEGKKVEGLLYSYILSYEKVADGKKRSNRRTVTYDIIQKRILQLEDIVNATVADSIRTDAGKAFLNIEFTMVGVNISYKKQQEQKTVNVFYNKDSHKFAPGFSETLDAIKKKMKEGAQNIDDSKVFDVVEDMPSFPGGHDALFKFISEKLRYPKQAEEHGIQGRVICNFIVEKDGSISNIKVQKSVNPHLDAEAVRVLRLMPKWKPGHQNYTPVRVMYTVPVSFRLK